MMMKYIFIIVVSSIILTNCFQSNKKTKTLDFNKFTIEVPNTWKKITLNGIDSYVGGFVTEDGDSITFDLGRYSNPLQNDGPGIMERSMWESFKDFHSQIDSSDYIIIEDSVWIDTDIYRKRNIKWDTIDGYFTKIVFPVRSGLGTTGIYIDSLKYSGFSKISFNLYGIDLKPENEKLFLEAIKSIKFDLE